MTRKLSFSLRKVLVRISALMISISVLGFAPESARAQCTTWIDGNSNWNTKTNWNPATVPNSAATNVCITNGSSTVTLDNSIHVANLQLAGGNTLDFGAGQFLTVNATQILNDGAIKINGGNGDLVLNNNVTLSGGGTLTLASSPSTGLSLVTPGGSLRTFSNSSTIEGAGVIGDGVIAINNSGTINANVAKSALSTGVLTLNGASSVTNTGTLEASSGGVLELVSNVNNTGGNIIANGSGASVNLVSSTIQGGTFTTGNGVIQTVGQATLNGAKNGAITITNGSTYVASRPGFGDLTIIAGTFNNSGNIQINGGNGGTLALGSDVTLNGPGTVTLAFNPSGGGASRIIGGSTLTNAAGSTIQGGGSIGANSDLTLVNAGTIIANSTQAPLILDANPILLGAPNVINNGTLQAADGGALKLMVVVNNQGGTSPPPRAAQC